METKEYIVALHEGVDYDQFWLDMENITSGLPHIPDRAVSITNDRPVFEQICEYALTDDEAERVRNDPRVYSIDQPIENMPWITIGKQSTQQTDNFTKPTEDWWTHNSTHPYVNWGLPRHSNATNIYANNSNPSYTYGLDGTGVDVLINDSGIQADHPEFTDANGNTRVVQVPWNQIATAANLNTKTGWDESSYVYGNTPIAEGHGTHVAGTVAGKTYGWAKNANIISLNAFHGSIFDIFSLIYLFHTLKGNNRPTVVNMSWGFFFKGSFTGFSGGSYRTQSYTASQVNSIDFLKAKGLIDHNGNGFPNITPETAPVSIGAYNSAIGALINAGIVIVKAAGNNGYKHDVLGGVDYNNRLFVTGPTGVAVNGSYFYHRGSSPYHPTMISVGNIDSRNSNNVDQANEGSVKGPAVDIWAAGTNIMSAWPNNAQDAMGYNYFKQPGQGRKQYNDSGTSMASPQVAGMCALYLQKYPTATPAEVKNWLLTNATNTILNAGKDSDYTNTRSLLGGAPRVAYQNLQTAPTTKSYIKDNTNTWREAKAVWVKHSDGTWKQARAGWQKNNAGQWVKIHQM
jgi:subtilisin family serine protease